jgi:hypothetical protein
MGPCLQNKLLELCEFSKDQKLKLKYRASRDGFGSRFFHLYCDGIANTLTVIKAKSGNIFGGFTEQEWNSDGVWIKDPKAFIFSLINKEVNPFKALCLNEGIQAICGMPDYGPCFGGGEGNHIKDILIQSYSNIHKDSFSDFGCSYQSIDYVKDTDKAKNILAGSQYFETVEIEVYAKTI